MSSTLCTTIFISTINPLHFITMDIIGKVKLSPQGHQYTFTLIDQLINYMLYTLMHTTKADEAMHASVVMSI